MKLQVNGETRALPGAPTLAELLINHGIDADEGGVAVAVNAAVVPRLRWQETTLNDGDDIEIIRAVQGG